MRSNLFKQSLKNFTESGKKRQQIMESKLLQIQLENAYKRPTTAPSVEEVPEVPPAPLTLQERCANADMNIQTFLKSTEPIRRRDIARELQQELSMMREPAQDQADMEDTLQQYHLSKLQSMVEQQQQRQAEIEAQREAQRELELQQIAAAAPEPPFQDVQLVQKNEHFIKFTFLLASYLDLKSSTLFIDNYKTCMRLCGLAVRTLLGRPFFDYVNGTIGGCTAETLYEKLLEFEIDESMYCRLCEFFRAAYRADAASVARHPLFKK